MTEPSTPTGPRLWLLIALPLLVQFGVLALGASILRALTSEPREDTTGTPKASSRPCSTPSSPPPSGWSPSGSEHRR